MNLQLYDTTTASASPNSLIGGAPGGPGLLGPTAEIVTRTVLDTNSTPGPQAPLGAILKRSFAPANAPVGASPFDSGALFRYPLTNSDALPFFSYGAVISPSGFMAGPNGTSVLVPNGEATICCEGVCLGLVKTAGTAVATTTPLVGQTDGTYTPQGTVAPGQVHAVGMIALAASQPATLIYINSGGY